MSFELCIPILVARRTLLGFHDAEKQSYQLYLSSQFDLATVAGTVAVLAPAVARVGFRQFTPHIKTPPAIMVATDCGL